RWGGRSRTTSARLFFARGRRRGRGRGRRGRRDRRFGGRRFGRFVLLAIHHHEPRPAVRFRYPLGFEAFHEVRQRRLLLRGRELRFDRRLGLLKRLLASRGRVLDAEDVVAKRGLDRTGEHVLLRREDRLVERFLLLAFDHAGELAAVGLARGVDRRALGDAGKALPGFDFSFRLLGSAFGLR